MTERPSLPPVYARSTIGVVAAVWSAVGLLFSTQQSIVGGSISLPDIAGVVAYDMLWAGLSLGVLATVRWQRARQAGTTRLIGEHALIALAAVPMVLTLYWALSRLLALWKVGGLEALLVSNLLIGLFLYALVLGVILLIEQRLVSRQRAVDRRDLERRLIETRAAMLRAQLQPHFLFNTLNTIAGLIAEEPRTAETMVARLGDLLRLSLDRNRGDMVTLAQDTVTLDAYLAIESLRMGSRLHIDRDVPAEVTQARVPDLLLQPLVENAIHHGLAKTSAGGTLRIAARRTGDMLAISVGDDGVGASCDMIRDGIGLTNTRERLRLIGGDLRIETEPGAGFLVRISLPWTVA